MTLAHFESFRAVPGRWGVSLNAPRAIHVARRLDEVVPLLEEAEREGASSWVAVALSYEAAPALDPGCKAHPSSGFPLAWAAVFDSESSPPEPGPKPFTISRWKPAVTRRHYTDAIRSIRDRIERGDVYQVNYTFPLVSEFHGDPWNCYQLLGKRQQAGYSAYLQMGDHTVLSFSPELLIERTGRILSTRPMKGTAPRGSPFDDQENAEKLRNSIKDRAENAMIVDLMRNDLSRVARVGTVDVPEMFAVEPYGPVLQMSSTVTAELDDQHGFVSTMMAIFPGGSITGAPKYASMSIIRELEPAPRGLYTGAIGYIRPGGDFIFNIAIRTMVIETGTGRATFGVGGGITWDSTAAGEYTEALLKAEFLSDPVEEFDLLETIGLHSGQYHLLERHLARAQQSAQYYGFRWDESAVRTELSRIAALHRHGSWKVRVTVSRDGHVCGNAHEMPARTPLQRVRFARSAVDRHDSKIFNKTTDRSAYDELLSAVSDVDDVILWNAEGEVTESTIANVVVEIDGQLYTPAMTSGLLAGTQRAELLDRGIVEERVITKQELAAAGSFFLLNSVRGWISAELIESIEV